MISLLDMLKFERQLFSLLIVLEMVVALIHLIHFVSLPSILFTFMSKFYPNSHSFFDSFSAVCSFALAHTHYTTALFVDIFEAALCVVQSDDFSAN